MVLVHKKFSRMKITFMIMLIELELIGSLNIFKNSFKLENS